MTAPIIHIAAALIFNAAGAMLLVRKAGTLAFMLPGGKIDAGESPEQALRRELREELALETGELRLLGAARADAANEPGAEVQAELFHVTQAQGDSFSPCAELAELRWIDPAPPPPDAPLAPLVRDVVLPIALSLNSA